jgi:hypothetical protein
MILKTQVPTKDRSLSDIADGILARRPGYVAEWMPADKTAGNGMVWIAARYLQTIIQRLNQAPDKNRIAFFDLLGFGLVPAQSARAPIVFELTDGASDTNAPATTEVAAPPPPGGTNQIVFETEQAVAVAAAKLARVVSLWAGRDQYLDHSAALQAGHSVTLFDPLLLQPTPHVIYLAHDTLLALTGSVEVEVEFELTQASSAALDVSWEYWDGKVWRGFQGMKSACAGIAEVKLDGTDGFTRSGSFVLQADCAQAQQTPVNGINAYWVRGILTEPLPPDPGRILPEAGGIRLRSMVRRDLDLTDSQTPRGGLLPDNAYMGGAKVDTTKAFYPFNQQPQPGSTFYFSSDEVFTKPGAAVTVAVAKQSTPQDQLGTPNLTHTLAWEYWNGTDWIDLGVGNQPSTSTPSANDFTDTGQISFTVPRDMVKTKVNNQDGYWVRVRLVDGGFGFSSTVTLPEGSSPASITYVVIQPPALGAFRLGYSWQKGPFHCEHVLAYNDFQYEDRTYEAQWPGSSFLPFKPVSDVTPALYLGFDKKLPVDDLGFYFDVVERPGDSPGPALLWEYWNGGSWLELSVRDETRALRLPGIISFIGAEDSQPYARFDFPYYWVRARLKEDGPPGEPVLNAILLNAVWASEQHTVNNLPLGASSGLPNQVFVFTQIPVLDGERIEVEELSGLQANVEWRILATELAQGDSTVVAALEEQLGQEGSETDIVYGDLRLQRDRTKRVSAVWVRWQPQPHFYFSGPGDRHYVLDRGNGRLYFGDGVHGRLVPAGAAILARQFRVGGGSAGNVGARSISQLLGSVPGVQAVFNPHAAEGGSDGETLESFRQRTPFTLRARGRAMTAADYETLARQASSAVAVAHAIPTLSSSGRPLPGWVTVLILPRSQEPRPMPSYELRDEVARYINHRAPADVTAIQHVYVTGPNYLPVDVEATLVTVDPSQAGNLEKGAIAALAKFLHPLTGGLQGQGWPPGRSVHVSDVAQALQGLEGLDHIEELLLYKDGVSLGESLTVAPDQSVVAGEMRLKVKAAVS